MTPIRLGVVAVACLVLPFLASADETPPAIDAEPSTPELQTTVRARRTPASAAEHVVEGATLAAAPRLGATDLLRLVPGLVASQHGGEGKAHQLYLRGFDAVHGEDIEVEVGGVPVNGVSHIHSLGYADLNFLIPEAVRAIDVTEGSYRADQGDFAVAGTLRFELGLAEPGLVASVGVGQFGQPRAVVGFGSRSSRDTFALAELSRGDGFGPARSYGRASVLAQAVTKVGDGAELRVLAGAYATRFDSAGVMRVDDLEAGRTDFFDSYDRLQNGYADRNQLLLELTLPKGDREGRTRFAAYGISSGLRLRQNFTGTFTDARGDGLDQRQDATTLGLRVTHARLLAHDARLELGVGARHDEISQGQRAYRDVDGTYYEDPTRDRAAEVSQSDLHAYADVALPLGPWTLRAGLRADALAVRTNDALAFTDRRFTDAAGYERAAFGIHLGVKAGISRALGERSRAFLSYGDGFRSPAAASLSEGERTPFVDVHGGELGLRFSGERLAFTTSAFGSYVADDVFFDHTVSTTVRTGATFRSGVSATVTGDPIEGLYCSVSATGAHALVLSTRTLLVGFAPFVGRADASYSRDLRVAGENVNIFTGLGFTAVGPRTLRFGEFGESYALVDARLGVRRGALELRLDIKNVLDARWRDGEAIFPSHFLPDAPASSLAARHYTAGAPRTAWLTALFHL